MQKGVVTPGRLELPTRSLGNCCSIHLSYGAIFRITTCNIYRLIHCCSLIDLARFYRAASFDYFKHVFYHVIDLSHGHSREISASDKYRSYSLLGNRKIFRSVSISLLVIRMHVQWDEVHAGSNPAHFQPFNHFRASDG